MIVSPRLAGPGTHAFGSLSSLSSSISLTERARDAGALALRLSFPCTFRRFTAGLCAISPNCVNSRTRGFVTLIRRAGAPISLVVVVSVCPSSSTASNNSSSMNAREKSSMLAPVRARTHTSRRTRQFTRSRVPSSPSVAFARTRRSRRACAAAANGVRAHPLRTHHASCTRSVRESHRVMIFIAST